MNKKIKTKNIFILSSLLCLPVLIFAGCAAEKDLYPVKASPEKLHRIQNLDIKAVVSEQITPEPNLIEPEHLDLTLEQCRAAALENNLDLKVQLINPSIAAEAFNAEQAKFESAFVSNISYSKTDSPTEAALIIAGSQYDYSYTSLGVQMPLQTGGELTFRLADNRTKTNFVSSTFNPSYTADFSLSISQPLLQGAGQYTNTHSIRIANYNRQITGAQTKLEVITVLAAADRVYWRLYAARKELQVRQSQYGLAQAQLEKTRRLVEAGQLPQVEIIRAEAGVASQLAAIITAENNLRLRQRELKQTLNKPNVSIQSLTILAPVTEPDPVRYNLDKSKLMEIALDNRMEMLELELQIAQDISTIDYYRNQALPLVTLNYTYNINGLGSVRSDAYDLLCDKNFEDHSLGLQVSIPLGNEAAKSRLRQAIFQKTQRLASKENRASLIKIEVFNAIDQLETNYQQILAARQSAILDGRLYEAEVRQLEVGLRTSTDVLQAQTQFIDSQTAEIKALAEYQIALVDLAYATGTLLGSAKIQWQPAISPIAVK